MPNLTELENRLRGEFSHDRLSADLEALASRVRVSSTAAAARTAADYLRRRLEENGLETAVYEFDSLLNWPEQAEPEVRVPIVVGALRGVVEPDRFVLLSGHYCRAQYGAPSGVEASAAMLETARVLAEHKGDLRRCIRVAFWPGPDQGRCAGSTWYADQFWEDLHDNCVLHLDVGNLGARAVEVPRVHATPDAWDFAMAAMRDALGEEVSPSGIDEGGDRSFWGCGVPTAKLVSTVPGELNRCAWMSLLATWRGANTPILPLRQGAAAREIREALESYEAGAGDRFDLRAVIARARDLEAFAIELDELLDQIRGGPDAEKLASIANQGLMELSRALVTVGSTATGPFELDLAVSMKAVPSLEPALRLKEMDPAVDETRYLVTELTRGRNRVAFYLRHALAAATETMVELRKALV